MTMKIRGEIYDLKIGGIIISCFLKNRGNFMTMKSRGEIHDFKVGGIFIFDSWKIGGNFISHTDSHINVYFIQ